MTTEPLDLDVIEERARRHQRDFSPHTFVPGGLTVNELVQLAIGAVAQMAADVEALLARVRTAEANAQRYRDQAVAAEEETRSWRGQVLASRAAVTTPAHCPSCDGYQSAVMDDGQRSVGACEGIAPRIVETAEEWEYGYSGHGSHPAPCDEEFASHRRRPARAAGPWEPVSTTVQYADPEEVRRLGAKIIAREKPILDRLAEHDRAEEAHHPHRYRSDGRDPYCATCHLPDIHGIHNMPEEPATARECGNDSHHGYGTGYCGDCTKEGGQ